MTSPAWTRREWITRNATAVIAAPLLWRTGSSASLDPITPAQFATWETLAQHAVEAAMRAGAQYADARLTRTLEHPVSFVRVTHWTETIGVGVRALVNGYWGFAAAPGGDRAAVERLAREAVAQAKINARGLPRMVDLGTIPPAVGTWTMPVKIDPFTVPFEEKLAFMQSWLDDAAQLKLRINTITSRLYFLRQERVVATSEGAHFTQTVYESGGVILVDIPRSNVFGGPPPQIPLEGFTPVGKGWELMLEADIRAQLRAVPERIEALRASQFDPKRAQIGRYTLVCDGATMAALVDQTLGIATQLDRAMGYEANASGTSFLNDPLAMLGTFRVGSPLVTVTANRSAPGQLATVKWDDEGVMPEEFTLIKDGVLVDYQTTREQAAWLAPYYQRQGRPTRSHGCAMAQNALRIPMQQTPNLALTPNATDTSLDALVADVKDGILVTNGQTTADFQSRTGTLQGTMREITNGKLGQPLEGGAILYDTLGLWRHVTALGGRSTQTLLASSWYSGITSSQVMAWLFPSKGEPLQLTSHSVQAVAATITDQIVIDLMRKV